MSLEDRVAWSPSQLAKGYSNKALSGTTCWSRGEDKGVENVMPQRSFHTAPKSIFKRSSFLSPVILNIRFVNEALLFWYSYQQQTFKIYDFPDLWHGNPLTTSLNLLHSSTCDLVPSPALFSGGGGAGIPWERNWFEGFNLKPSKYSTWNHCTY